VQGVWCDVVVPVTSRDLHFRVSAGLKNIIGQDLITNDFVAVFELVKNSYDAQATRVDLYFLPDTIFIVDNGKGMTFQDVVDKWLFVAYSAKRHGTEDEPTATSPVAYAGSKGVGRFSCDRLGHALLLQTRAKTKGSEVQSLQVDWDAFELDDTKEFAQIKVKHSTAGHFELPKEVRGYAHGTVLEIQGVRTDWDRAKLFELKGYLSKLINPIENLDRPFQIHIHAPTEEAQDKAAREKVESRIFPEGPEDTEMAVYSKTVNGQIQNFIFRELTAKTTQITVEMSADGKALTTTLIDRGELIYQIRERNPYSALAKSDFVATIHYLNQAAKAVFTRRTGIRPVDFGSLFLFRNGFRVFPVGEPTDDTFMINRRKQQGYARFLGTREIIGRVDVRGSEIEFKEATSRDQGLIETPAYEELRACVWDKCLKRLENYVVGVTWVDKLDAQRTDASGLQGDKARARIISVVSKLIDDDQVEVLNYSRNLVSIINEKAEEFADSLKALRLVAGRTGDNTLAEQIRKAEARFKELQLAEQASRAQAEAERKARLEAEEKARQAEQAQRVAEGEKRVVLGAYEEERKRGLFLASLTSLDLDTIVNLHHQIGIYASNIHNLLAVQLEKLADGQPIERDDLISVFENLSYKNQQILAVSRIATKANFRLDSEKIKGDLVHFIIEYVQQVCSQYVGPRTKVLATPTAVMLETEFKPIEVSMIIDNLVSNAQRALAGEVRFDFAKPTSKILEIRVSDDGIGLKPTVLEPSRIFERGFSTTDGSGLGLYHVRQIVDSMKGSIEVNTDVEEGLQFILRLPG